MPKARPGKVICFEGADGVGKSTLLLAVELVMRGRGIGPIHIARFPSDGHVGQIIRKTLVGEHSLDLKSALYLFAADGLNESPKLRMMRAAGYYILCDRHPTLSGRAYQLAHHAEREIEAVYNAADADDMLYPDELFIVSVPPPVALKRISGRDKYRDVVYEKEDLSHQLTIHNRYLALAKRYGATVLDGTKSLAALSREVVQKVENQLAA